MNASEFSDAQKAFILKQVADGVLVEDIFLPAGITQAAYFSWKKKYEGLNRARMRLLTSASDSLRPKAESLDTALNRAFVLMAANFCSWCAPSSIGADAQLRHNGSSSVRIRTSCVGMAQDDSDKFRVRPCRIRQGGTRQSGLASLPFRR